MSDMRTTARHYSTGCGVPRF